MKIYVHNSWRNTEALQRIIDVCHAAAWYLLLTICGLIYLAAR